MNLLGRIKNRLRGDHEPVHDPTSVTHADAMQWFEHRRDEYERLIAAAAPYVERDGVIFDIGANIGYFSLLLTARTNFRGTVYLFEPVPHLATLCRQTFATATSYRAEVHGFGLSDSNGEVECMVAGNGNLGWNTLITAGADADMQSIKVPVKAFDDAAIAATPSFIKIDVEGAEYKVLAGMATALQRWTPRPIILCEVGWGRSHPDWDAEIAAFYNLATLGYGFFDLDRNPISIADLEGTTDVLCLPALAAARATTPIQ